ncbi:hypothetical protein KY333_04180 [Candidatus Woesearchaeota archaeon]|nr:hypothetical protein [Candidatus Woesearchaeota archaeon]MBW2993921.1 hypothetical protein [Candidatus Woesearchaeota archaeon]
MEKRNAIILIGVIAIILIIVAILIISFWPSEYKQVYNEQYADCIEQNKELYYVLMAKKTGDDIYCNQDNIINEKCLAFATKNPQSYCADLDGDESASCYAEILQDASKCPKNDAWCLAIASGDSQFCEKLGADDVEECKRLLPQNADYWISDAAEKECKSIATSAAESRMKLKSI